MTLPDLDLSTLDPGIRRTVAWLRSIGFETTDSGDGKTKLAHPCPRDCPWAGKLHEHVKAPEEIEAEGILDMPHVHMVVRAEPGRSDAILLIEEADRLWRCVRDALAIEPAPGQICATYDPADRIAILSLYEIDDSMIPEGLGR